MKLSPLNDLLYNFENYFWKSIIDHEKWFFYIFSENTLKTKSSINLGVSY